MTHSQMWNPLLGHPKYEYWISLNPSHPINRNLVRWWLCNEPGVGPARDIVRQQHLAMTGTVPVQSTAKGCARGAYATVGDYLSRADTGISSDASGLTLACWAFFTDVTNAQYLMSLGNNGASGMFGLFKRSFAAGNTIGAVKQNDAGVGGTAYSAGTVTVNTWMNFVGIFISPTSRYAAIDGVLGAQDVTNIANPTADYQALGVLRRAAVTSQAANAYINNAAIWTRDLSTAEVLSLYLEPYGSTRNPRLIVEPRRAYA